MPFYQKLDAKTVEGHRTIEGLLRLRKGLGAEIPRRTLRETFLLATWNIRDFDKPAYGNRMDEAIYYIAEIIAKFDIVAVQEIYRDMKGLQRVLSVLGGSWKYVCTDATEGGRGNDERMAFLYDSRKIRFGGLAGEIVLPPIKQADGSFTHVPQFWRTPFVCGFQAGWCRFMLATVHILWGVSEAEPAYRVNEIRQIAQFLKARTRDRTAWARNLILLGDFNIFDIEDATFEELTNAGFIIPEELRVESNASKGRHYDQVAFRVRKNSLDMTGKAGVFDFYQYVYRVEDEPQYVASMGEAYYTTSKGKQRTESGKRRYYKTYWRTHQMSDHLVKWVELKIDYSDKYLKWKLDQAS